MPFRLGPGPVFAYEWLTFARRWQPYAMRAGFVWLILLGVALVESGRPWHAETGWVSLSDLAMIGEPMYRTMATIELTLVLLAAPAATAGAVCLDKARGTLDHMLATDLSNAEIVLGKLGVRLIPVLGLVACALPVLALASLMGGISPTALAGLFIVSIGCAVLGCSMAMALSIYGRKAHEVVMMAYMLILLWVMAAPLVEVAYLGGPPSRAVGAGRWWMLLEWSNPYYLAYAPYSDPDGVDGTTYLGFLTGCLIVSAVFVILAVVRVRRVSLRQAAHSASPGRRRWWRTFTRAWLPGPSLDANPVAWREWHRGRPSLMARLAWGLYMALGLFWVGVTLWPLRQGMRQEDIAIGVMSAVQVSIGLVLLSVGAATSLAEERARGSLDVLLSTPIPTRSILAGKWWGSFRAVFGVLIWPAAMSGYVALDNGYWAGCGLLLGLVLAHGAAITSLGLAIATWVSRVGRAIAVCMTIHLVCVIVWPFLVMILLRDDRDLGQALMAGDPPVGVLFATMATSANGVGEISLASTRGEVFLWTFGWIAILAILAAALFKTSVATFDGCLGRIPDAGLLPPIRRRGRSSLSDAELLALVSSSSGDEAE